MNLSYLDQIKKADINTMNFKQIFALYDKNFEYMCKFLHEIGVYSSIETFTNVRDNKVTLSKGYTPGRNQLIVYVNNAIQWEGEGYNEISSSQIEFTFDIDSNDEVKVITITSWSITDCFDKYYELLNRITALEGAVSNGILRVTQKDYDDMKAHDKLLKNVMYVISDSK